MVNCCEANSDNEPWKLNRKVCESLLRNLARPLRLVGGAATSAGSVKVMMGDPATGCGCCESSKSVSPPGDDEDDNDILGLAEHHCICKIEAGDWLLLTSTGGSIHPLKQRWCQERTNESLLLLLLLSFSSWWWVSGFLRSRSHSFFYPLDMSWNTRHWFNDQQVNAKSAKWSIKNHFTDSIGINFESWHLRPKEWWWWWWWCRFLSLRDSFFLSLDFLPFFV